MPAEKMTPSGLSLEYWTKQLTQMEMPAFAHTARIIAGEASHRESSASRLAKLILQDPSMTIRLLKMANSTFFNPMRKNINTVTRAIVLLGFKTVRSMCMSIAIMDTMLEDRNKEPIMREFADSFHAAIQSRTIAAQRKDKSPEEVFIATLLLHLGKFSFWTFANKIDKDAMHRLQQTLSSTDEDTADPETQALGFSFRELSAALNDEWHLSSLLDAVLSGKENADPRVHSVSLAHEIVQTARNGWNSPQMKQLIKRLAETLYMPVDSVEKVLQKNAECASTTLAKLGAKNLSMHIATPDREHHETQAGSSAKHDSIPAANNPESFPKPDRALQLQILSDIIQLIEQKPDINLLLEMVLEGLHRGVGMDRALFALMSPDKRRLKAKYTIGWDHRLLSQSFHFELGARPLNIFDVALSKQASLWIQHDNKNPLAELVNDAIRKILGDTPFFVMAIAVKGKPIGLFYADRRPSKRQLDEESFSSFQLFCKQATLCLNQLKNSKR